MQKNLGNKVAGNDEKNLYARKPAGHSADGGMEHHRRHYGQCAHTVNIAAVGMVWECHYKRSYQKYSGNL